MVLATAGQTSDKSDVYAFGVVVLEVMTGMQAVDARRPQGCEALPQLLHPALQAVQLMQVSSPAECRAKSCRDRALKTWSTHAAPAGLPAPASRH